MDVIQVTIRYPGGLPTAAVLLVARGTVISLAVDGCDDPVDFRLIDGQWFSERGQSVRIDSKPLAAPYLRPASGAPSVAVPATRRVAVTG